MLFRSTFGDSKVVSKNAPESLKEFEGKEIVLGIRPEAFEDAIYATKAALQEGIVSGGGIALLNAANTIKPENIGEKILFEAIKAPFKTILANAGIENYEIPVNIGEGYNVITGEIVNMIDSGIIDPVLVTKTALKNAISVVNTIVSADCVISNMRMFDESGK